MMRINLLGVTRPAVAAPSPPTTGGRLALIFVISLIVCFAPVLTLRSLWSKSVDNLQQEYNVEKRREAELAAVKEQNLRYQQDLNRLQQLINTIQALQNSRVGPADFMNALGLSVNRTTDLYLLTVVSQGTRINVRGQANSVNSIATFIADLQRSTLFDDVQLRDSYQDDQGVRVTFKFDLDCVYKGSGSTTPGTQPGAGPAAPVRRAGM